MPATVVVHVLEARNLPIMDWKHNSTDAFVEVKFGNNELRTGTHLRSLNPVWDAKFEFTSTNDLELQEDWIRLRVLDADLLKRGGTIGDVIIDVSVLLQRDSASASHRISGWFPIYDTRKGVRGQLFVTVTVEFLADTSKYAESSTGVMFFRLPLCPSGFEIKSLKGFVEELVIKRDPDFHYAALLSLRATRKTNEMRTELLYECTALLKRLVGRKALDMGGNAMIGMCIHFDIEEDSGIVCRGYGTCCVLKRVAIFETLAFQQATGNKSLALKLSDREPPPLSLDANAIITHNNHHNNINNNNNNNNSNNSNNNNSSNTYSPRTSLIDYHPSPSYSVNQSPVLEAHDQSPHSHTDLDIDQPLLAHHYNQQQQQLSPMLMPTSHISQQQQQQQQQQYKSSRGPTAINKSPSYGPSSSSATASSTAAASSSSATTTTTTTTTTTPNQQPQQQQHTSHMPSSPGVGGNTSVSAAPFALPSPVHRHPPSTDPRSDLLGQHFASMVHHLNVLSSFPHPVDPCVSPPTSPTRNNVNNNNNNGNAQSSTTTTASSSTLASPSAMPLFGSSPQLPPLTLISNASNPSGSGMLTNVISTTNNSNSSGSMGGVLSPPLQHLSSPPGVGPMSPGVANQTPAALSMTGPTSAGVSGGGGGGDVDDMQAMGLGFTGSGKAAVMGGGQRRLLTMKAFPNKFDLKYGTVVTARSVKRLPEQSVRQKLEDMHDGWWDELRREVLRHCREAMCSHVTGYAETCSINANEDICVLSAMGTAVTLSAKTYDQPPCSCCHLPLHDTGLHDRGPVYMCGMCGAHPVPEVILSTTEPPSNVLTIGPAVRIEATVLKQKRQEKPEAAVSELLPFIEYDLHRQLLMKLRVAQRNAAFGMTVQLSISDDHILAVSTATALFLKPLPKAPPLTIPPSVSLHTRGRDVYELAKAAQLKSQRNAASLAKGRVCTMTLPLLGDTFPPNLNSTSASEKENGNGGGMGMGMSVVQQQTGDVYGADSTPYFPSQQDDSAGEQCVSVEVGNDQPSLLAVDQEPAIPKDAHMSNLLSVTSNMRDFRAAFNLITIVKRVTLDPDMDTKNASDVVRFLSDIYQDMYSTMFFRLRSFPGLTLQALNIQIDAGDHTIQFVATAAAIDSHRHRQPRPNVSQIAPYDNVVLTPLASVQGEILAELGLVHIHLVREASDGETITDFSQMVLIEAQILLRSKVGAMGGNVVLGFAIDQFKLEEGANHYAMVSISGDAYAVRFLSDNI